MTAFSTANMLGANLALVYTLPTDTGGELSYPRPPYAVGQGTTGTDGSQWVYVQANGAIAQYDWVGIDEDYQAGALTDTMAGDGWMIGVAQVAFADNQFGWVCIKGANVSGNVLASCAADVALYTCSLAGSLDDATALTKIDGVVAVTARASTAGSTEVLLTWPRSSAF